MTRSAEIEKSRRLFEEMLAAIAGPDPGDVRKVYDDLFETFEVPNDIEISEVSAGGVPSYLVNAPGTSRDRTLVYYHGGGLLIGTAHGYRGLGYALSKAGDTSVLLVDYRRTPETAFPGARDDAIAAAKWAIGQVGAESVVLGGDSAGGGLTVLTEQALRDEGLPLPAGVVLYSPWLDWSASGESHERNKDIDPVVSAEMMSGMAAAYLQNGEDTKDPLVSALFADQQGLAPALIFVGTAEQLEDDARGIDEQFKAAGVPSELHVVEDCVHVYPVFHDFLPEAQDAIQRSGAFIRERTAAKVA